MNILITGKNGFIGKELTDFFSETEHTVYSTCRKTLDVSDIDQVDGFFGENDIDVVLHTAIVGGRRMDHDTFDDFITNLNMFYNLYQCISDKQLLISFGSGAECRTDTYYGLAKNIINQEIQKINNAVNLRLYGCFGSSEADGRFIKSAYACALNNQPIVVHQNKYMDYLYVGDLKKITRYYVENFFKMPLPKSLDLCYNEKITLFQIANEIKNLTNSNNMIIMNEKEFDSPYTGSGTELSNLDIGLCGLYPGIKQTIKELEIINNG